MRAVAFAFVAGLLFQASMRQRQFRRKDRLLVRLISDLAFNIAYDTAQPGLQPFRLAASSLVLT